MLYPNLDADYRFARAQEKYTLELGCGMGYNAQRLAQRPVQLTRERLLLRDLPAAFLVADAEHLPFAPCAFEMIFSSGVMHLLPNTTQAAREIMRVLRAGGASTVMVYNRNSRWFWWNITVIMGALMWLFDSLPIRSRERFLAVRPAWWNLILPSGQRLRFSDVVRAGTDFGGLLDPLSRVYTKHSARRLFPVSPISAK